MTIEEIRFGGMYADVVPDIGTDIETAMAKAEPCTKSVSGCMTGSYSWGTAYKGSYDGVKWKTLGTPSRTHTQNNAPTGWEQRGTFTTAGQTGIVGWRRYKFIVRLSVGPEIHQGDQYLGRSKSVTVWKVPSAERNISVARAVRRAVM